MPDVSLYASDHEVRLQMEGLEKPRRKRGRPAKMEFKVFILQFNFHSYIYIYIYIYICYIQSF